VRFAGGVGTFRSFLRFVSSSEVWVKSSQSDRAINPEDEQGLRGDRDILIRGGLIVTGKGIEPADLAISGEKITGVGTELDVNPEEVIDATGSFILPGFIDAHTHPDYLDGLENLSRAAALGGVTTLIHHSFARPGESLVDTVGEMKRDGERESLLDFNLHGALSDPESQAEEIPEVEALGISSFKFLMAYSKDNVMTDDYQLMRSFDLVGNVGGLAMVHAENGPAIDYLEDKFLDSNLQGVEFTQKTRPGSLEAEAINRAVSLAKQAECPLYVVHISTSEGLKVVGKARKENSPVFTETCPQYLTLTRGALDTMGSRAKIAPPLRGKEDNQALWDGLRNGTIDVIASDHAAHSKEVDDFFWEAPYGMPVVQEMPSVVFTESFRRGKLSLVRMVQTTSENPARIFGLYPKKGTLQAGSDADLVVFDPGQERTITHKRGASHAPYSAFEGYSCLGVPELVMQRGKVIAKDGQVSAEPGRGKFVSAKKGASNTEFPN